MYSINACMVCGEEKRTIVSEYNRLIFIDAMWQSELARFDYALCHGCGLVYATRRPDRKEYDFLYENFGEFLLRKANAKTFNQASVPAEMAAEIDRAFLPWWEIRLASGPQASIRKRLKYDLTTALDFLSYLIPHVPLEGAKVLHVRAKGATLGDMLKRLLGAKQVDLITLFPPHKYLAEKYAGIRAQACLDYEEFKIPFDEKYDLIIANHILLHMLDATQTFEVYRAHLQEGGRTLPDSANSPMTSCSESERTCLPNAVLFIFSSSTWPRSIEFCAAMALNRNYLSTAVRATLS